MNVLNFEATYNLSCGIAIKIYYNNFVSDLNVSVLYLVFLVNFAAYFGCRVY